jgi:hypothetical protein
MQDEQTRTRYAQLLGLAFCAVGFVAIGLGWRGAARVACIDCQVPYLISGAATGIGLIILGVGLLIGARIRVERMRLAEHMAGLMAGTAAAGEAAPKAASNGRVVVGGNSYHRPDCRLVREKSGLTMVSIEEAQSSGLSACRVCHPERAEARTR